MENKGKVLNVSNYQRLSSASVLFLRRDLQVKPLKIFLFLRLIFNTTSYFH